jgi:hypothetical protein
MSICFCCFGDDELASMGITTRTSGTADRELRDLSTNGGRTSIQDESEDSNDPLLDPSLQTEAAKEVIPKRWFKDKRSKLEAYRSHKNPTSVYAAKKEVFPEFIVAFIELLEMRDKMSIQENIQLANKGKNKRELDEVYSDYIQELLEIKDNLNEALGSLDGLGMSKDSILNLVILSVFSKGAIVLEN